MCGVTRSPACRVCLTSNLKPPYTCLTADAVKADLIGNMLQLQSDLKDPALLPHHVCNVCSDKIDAFLDLQGRAIESEKVILKHQKMIVEKGLQFALISIENDKNGAKEEIIHWKDKAEKRKKKTHSCIECDVNFKRKGALLNHNRAVHQNLSSECAECGMQVKDLNYHRRSVHQKVSFECTQCARSYTSKGALEYHTKTVHHTTDTKEVCPYCAAELSTKSMKLHLKLKHSEVPVEKSVPCQQCDKCFRTKQQAEVHFKSVHLNLKEECKECGGMFKNLLMHKNEMHKHGKQFTCDQCGKSFSKSHDLKLHKERIHLAKRYICPVCGKKLSKVLEHLRRIHGEKNLSMENIQEAPPANVDLVGPSFGPVAELVGIPCSTIKEETIISTVLFA